MSEQTIGATAGILVGCATRGSAGSAMTIDELLTRTRSQLVRLDPQQAWRAQQDGAVLVDIRPEINRRTEGEIPGAVVIERIVLEWRLDPASDARLPIASYDTLFVLVCNEGYSSSLAAATLQDLGLHRATDLDGGYRAWRAAGLPTLERVSLAQNSALSGSGDGGGA